MAKPWNGGRKAMPSPCGLLSWKASGPFRDGAEKWSDFRLKESLAEAETGVVEKSPSRNLLGNPFDSNVSATSG